MTEYFESAEAKVFEAYGCGSRELYQAPIGLVTNIRLGERASP